MLPAKKRTKFPFAYFVFISLLYGSAAQLGLPLSAALLCFAVAAPAASVVPHVHYGTGTRKIDRFARA